MFSGLIRRSRQEKTQSSSQVEYELIPYRTDDDSGGSAGSGYVVRRVADGQTSIVGHAPLQRPA